MRFGWMDTLRGVAILLVILHHAIDLSAMFSGVGVPDVVREFDVALLPYRMPMLLVLSGMLLDRALAKPLPRYYLGKVRTLLWPYAVWVCVFWLVVRPDGFPAWREWIATSWLWYIFYLALYFAVAPILAKLPVWMPPVLLWVVSAWVSDAEFTSFLVYGGYFYAGRLLWRWRALGASLRHPLWALAGAALILVFSTAYVLQERGAGYPVPLRHEELLYAPVTVLTVLGFIAIARLIPDAWTGPLRVIGRQSIVFYVIHFPMQILITQAVGLWSWDWRLHIAFGVAGPLILGALLMELRRHRMIDALFVLPGRWAQVPAFGGPKRSAAAD